MAKSREQIKRDGVAQNTYVSPHFGDGGWHTQVGGCWFDPRQIRPLHDHVLIELEEISLSGIILKPETVEMERGTRIGTVLRVGPGRFNEDEWRLMPMILKAGDRVAIGPYSDWESWDAWIPGPNVVLCREPDVRVVVEA